MNYKDFDLAKAITGHPLVTRDGRTVTEFHWFKGHIGKYPCAATLTNETELFTYTDIGTFFEDGREHKTDLFLAPTEVTMWGNVYKRGTIYSDIYQPIYPDIYQPIYPDIYSARYTAIYSATVPVTFNTWKP